jgi:hypothetical protein
MTTHLRLLFSNIALVSIVSFFNACSGGGAAEGAPDKLELAPRSPTT